jgi:hypothetical protein
VKKEYDTFAVIEGRLGHIYQVRDLVVQCNSVDKKKSPLLPAPSIIACSSTRSSLELPFH